MEEFSVLILAGEPKFSGLLLPKAFFSEQFFLQSKLDIVLFSWGSIGHGGALNFVELNQHTFDLTMNIPKVLSILERKIYFGSVDFST
jgi:hypothetical protein